MPSLAGVALCHKPVLLCAARDDGESSHVCCPHMVSPRSSLPSLANPRDEDWGMAHRRGPTDATTQ